MDGVNDRHLHRHASAGEGVTPAPGAHLSWRTVPEGAGENSCEFEPNKAQTHRRPFALLRVTLTLLSSQLGTSNIVYVPWILMQAV